MENRYKKEFLNSAIKLDQLAGYEGRVTRIAMDITDKNDNASILSLLKIFTPLSDTVDGSAKRMVLAVKDSLTRYLGEARIINVCEEQKTVLEDDRSLNQLLAELDQLVGLKNVKSQVNDLIAFQKVQKLRKDFGLSTSKSTLHMAFTGKPGTGKTTVARIVGHIYKQIGLLSKGHFTEVSRTDLIAGYQGQTALKVKSVIEKAKGGVLFIDEAYSITENEHTDSYGRECLTELTKALEDYRKDLVVIVAGYTEPMKLFFESNPGLKSRFNTFIEFEDYSEEELYEIFQRMCEHNQYMLMDGAIQRVKGVLEEAVSKQDEEFANGRFVRNLYEDIVMNQSRRVAQLSNPTVAELVEIREEDVQ